MTFVQYLTIILDKHSFCVRAKSILSMEFIKRSRSGVLNRGEISPMGEILGIQGGIESV